MEEFTQESPIEVALTVYDPQGTYSQHAGVVMASIFEHTTSLMRVHILHDKTLTDDNRQKFLRTARKYDQQVEFHDLTDAINNLGADALAIADGRYFSRGTLFRLFVPDVLDCDRVLFLDCDIVVGLDVREYWSIDLKGNCFTAVLPRDWDKNFFCSETLRIALLGIHRRNYPYSGSLLMDLKKIRERPVSMIEAAPAWFERYRHLTRYPDMDFMNAFFLGAILFVPEKFNKILKPWDECLDDAVLHANWALKPWDCFGYSPFEVLYWRMYLKTAWGEDMSREELLDRLRELSLRNPKLHRHASQCWRGVSERLFSDVFCHGLLKYCTETVKMLGLLLGEARYWISRPFRKKIS